MLKHLIITLVFIGLALPLGHARADDSTNSSRMFLEFLEGFDAVKEGDYSTAVRIFSALAEQGHARAQICPASAPVGQFRVIA